MSELHAQTVAQVRDTMLPPAPPPRREVGAIRWLRENLFSGPLNILLTVLALWFLWTALHEALPWAWRGIWRAGSLSECRAIRDQLYPEGTPAACWAVLTERWRQLVFGFYPASQVWRPPLALAVFLLAVLPILFAGLPRRLLWLTAAAPFLIVWLLWGGTIWWPVAIALGLAAVLLVAQLAGRRGGVLAAVFATFGVFTLVTLLLTLVAFVVPSWLLGGPLLVGLLALLLYGALIPMTVRAALGSGGALVAILAAIGAAAVLFFDPLTAFMDLLGSIAAAFGLSDGPPLGSGWAGVLPLVAHVPPLLDPVAPVSLPPVASRDFGGFTLSIIIGLSGICLSLPLGILLALARRSDLFIISKAAIFYIEVIRGVPLIVWLFVAQLILNYFLPSGTNFDILLRVIIMVTLFAAAYIAEVVRGGLAALPRGQYEAGDAMGLTYWQSMQLIVLPQALKISIPGIVNSFIGLFKDTTLVSIIAMFDPIRMASTIRATTEWGGIYWELYVFVGLTFFVFCFAMSRYSIWLERRLERSHAR